MPSANSNRGGRVLEISSCPSRLQAGSGVLTRIRKSAATPTGSGDKRSERYEPIPAFGVPGSADPADRRDSNDTSFGGLASVGFSAPLVPFSREIPAQISSRS